MLWAGVFPPNSRLPGTGKNVPLGRLSSMCIAVLSAAFQLKQCSLFQNSHCSFSLLSKVSKL